MIDVIATMIGGWLITASWLSVLRAVFAQGQVPPRVARWAPRLVAAVIMPVAARVASHRRERLLALCGPLALFAMFGVWFAGTTTGFLLLAAAFDTATSVLSSAGSVSGALLIGVFVVHLIRIAAAHSRREMLVARLSAEAAAPSDAERMIAIYVQSGSRDRLDTWFGEWAGWLADVRCTHVSNPVLVYLRPTGELSWVAAAVIALDAAALVESMAPEWAPSNTRVLLETGATCLQRVAADAGIVLPRRMTVSLHGREQRCFADTMRMTKSAGLPVVRTQSLAWEVFQRERTRYAPYAAAVAARLRYGLDAGRALPGPVVVAEQSGELLR
jgi:hypothetical protein